MMLELHYGLNIDNPNHIWLLQFLFLPLINQQLGFFAESWNHHKLQIRDGPNRSPIDMFGFDMLVHGVRGREIELDEEELEVYGIDWDALEDDALRASQVANNPITEDSTSWVGRTGLPDNLAQVTVESPEAPLNEVEIHTLYTAVQPLLSHSDDTTVANVWSTALTQACILCPNIF